MSDQVFAKMAHLCSTSDAVAAHIESRNCNTVADRETPDVIAESGHRARELVAHYLREYTSCERVRVVGTSGRPVEVLVQVGSAQAVVGYGKLDLTGSWFWFGELFNSQVPVTVQSRGEHDKRVELQLGADQSWRSVP